MSPPPKKRQRRTPCTQCSLALAPLCNGEYPCAECVQRGVICGYPTRRFSLSAWDAIRPEDVQHFPEALTLSGGTEGAAGLWPEKMKEGGEGLRWRSAVLQRHDTRIRQHPLYEPLLVYPATIPRDGENEVRQLDLERIQARASSDRTLLEGSGASISTIHPTVILNAVLADRNSATTNPNIGNCLALATVRASPKGKARSRAVWRSGDASGRPNAVTTGDFRQERRGDASTDVEDPHEATLDGRIPLRKSSYRFPSFWPSAKTLSTFESPVLQIQLAPLATAPTALLGVRTATTISLLQTDVAGSTKKEVLAEFSFKGRDLGRQPIADFVLGGVDGGDAGSGMVVDEAGALWGWGLGLRGTGRIGDRDWNSLKPEMFRLRRGRRGRKGSGFARVGYGGVRGLDAVVGYEDEVLLFDLRSPRAAATLLPPQFFIQPRRGIPSSQLTSLSPSSSSRALLSLPATRTGTALHVFCTTRELVWIDDRMPGKELMAWEHGRVGNLGRGVDRTLSLLRVHPGSEDVTLDSSTMERVVLHSRTQPILSFYTYSSNPTEAPRSLVDPYSLPPPVNSVPPWSRTGLAVVPAETNSLTDVDSAEAGWLVLESASDGGVYSRYTTLRDYSPLTAESTLVPAGARRHWDEDVQELARDANERIDSLVPKVVDERLPCSNLRQARNAVFCCSSLDAAKEADPLDQRLRLAGDALMSTAAPAIAENPGVLTLFDLLVLSKKDADVDNTVDSPNEREAKRIASLPRPTTFGRRPPISVQPTRFEFSTALQLVQPAADKLEAAAAWTATLAHDDLASAPSYFRRLVGCDYSTKWRQADRTKDALMERYYLESGSAALHETACERVVLDTTFASYLYSPSSIVNTEAGDFANAPQPPERNPPKLELSYFVVARDEADPFEEAEEEANAEPSLEAVSTRLLVNEWTLRSDPRLYTWSNPYAKEKLRDDASQARLREAAPGRANNRSSSAVVPFPSSAFQWSQLERRLEALPEDRVSPFHSGRVASQPIPQFETGEFASSQSQMAVGASQILPGAFGGRAGAGKGKKKGKKRVSGF